MAAICTRRANSTSSTVLPCAGFATDENDASLSAAGPCPNGAAGAPTHAPGRQTPMPLGPARGGPVGPARARRGVYSARGHSGGKLLQTDLGGQSRRFTFGRHAEFCCQQATQRLILLQRTGTVATSGQGQHDLAVRVLPIGIQLDEPPGKHFPQDRLPLAGYGIRPDPAARRVLPGGSARAASQPTPRTPRYRGDGSPPADRRGIARRLATSAQRNLDSLSAPRAGECRRCAAILRTRPRLAGSRSPGRAGRPEQ